MFHYYSYPYYQHLLHFITFELDINPFSLIFNETWIPNNSISYKFINEFLTYDDEFDYFKLIRDGKIDNRRIKSNRLNYSRFKKFISFIINDKCQCLKLYKYKINLNHLNFKWIADQRFDIESLLYLSLKLVDRYKQNKLSNHYKIFIDNKLTNFEFNLFIKSFFEILINSINSFLINYKIQLINRNELINIKETNQNDDFGLILSFIINGKNPEYLIN